jgi:hypothetical protein
MGGLTPPIAFYLRGHGFETHGFFILKKRGFYGKKDLFK